jgi:hypothetical protein
MLTPLSVYTIQKAISLGIALRRIHRRISAPIAIVHILRRARSVKRVSDRLSELRSCRNTVEDITIFRLRTVSTNRRLHYIPPPLARREQGRIHHRAKSSPAASRVAVSRQPYALATGAKAPALPQEELGLAYRLANIPYRMNSPTQVKHQ